MAKHIKINFSKRKWGIAFMVLGVAIGLVYVWQYFNYSQGVSRITREAIAESIRQADMVTEKTTLELQNIEKIADELLAKDIDLLPIEMQRDLLGEVFEQDKFIYGIGLVHDGGAAGNRPDLLVSKASGSRYRLDADSLQWAEERQWYGGFKAAPKTWSDSAFIKGINKAPKVQLGKLIGERDDPRGALFFHLSLDDLSSILNTAKLGNAGYAFIVSKNGRFIYHPVDEWVLSGKSIYTAGYGDNNSKIKRGIEKAIETGNELIEFRNPMNGLDSWYFFEPIAGTDWVIGVTFFKEEMVNNIFSRKKSQIILSLLMIMALGSFLLGINFLYGSRQTTYIIIASATAMLLVGIIYVISVSFKYPILKPYDVEKDDIKIAEKPVLEHYLDIQDSVFEKFEDTPPSYIKTGIYLEHAYIREAHMVMVSGYIWQEYDLEEHADLRRGVLFPEADPHPEYLNVQEAYREIRDGKEIIGWHFRVAIRKKFNYAHFPFDWQNIRIKIWHPDFVKNVFCIPDLDSYPILNPSTLPGIKSKFEFPNWSVQESFFSFKNTSFNTDFGLRDGNSRRRVPEMCFNLYVKRVYLSPLVSNIFTIAIIIILLFVAQVIESKKGRGANKGILLGSLGLIELSAAFSFVLIIAHTSLRDNLSVEELIYIDYYYFTTYFMILLTCLNFVIMSRNIEKGKIEGAEDQDWLKIHFWPIVFGIFYVVTVFVFY